MMVAVESIVGTGCENDQVLLGFYGRGPPGQIKSRHWTGVQRKYGVPTYD